MQLPFCYFIFHAVTLLLFYISCSYPFAVLYFMQLPFCCFIFYAVTLLLFCILCSYPFVVLYSTEITLTNQCPSLSTAHALPTSKVRTTTMLLLPTVGNITQMPTANLRCITSQKSEGHK
jgi:hypothetical protein